MGDRSPASRRRVSEQPLQYPCRWHTQWMRKKQKAEETGEGEAEEDASESYDFGGRRILLAEDTGMKRGDCHGAAGACEHACGYAWNGEEACGAVYGISTGTYMAVLMDVQMPGMNGYEAATKRSAHRRAAARMPERYRSMQ